MLYEVITHALGFLETQAAVGGEAVMVVDVYVGGELAAALLPAPLARGVAQGARHAAPAVLRTDKDALQEQSYNFV